MDDFSREFCNWDKLREQRSKIKTEIENNIKNLPLEDLDNMEDKNINEYLKYLQKIRVTINNIYDSKYVDKMLSLINIFEYLSDIEFLLTQIRLNNIYIEKNEE